MLSRIVGTLIVLRTIGVVLGFVNDALYKLAG